MTRTYFLPILAVVGLAIAIGAVIQGNESAPAAPPIVLPAKVAFPSYIAGSGIIEARSQNIAIGTPVSGIVTAINVKWDDWVNTGDVLFKIDDGPRPAAGPHSSDWSPAGRIRTERRHSVDGPWRRHPAPRASGY
jgi:multidrug efflux pump subunit AcrA (membrane-fusion protein)